MRVYFYKKCDFQDLTLESYNSVLDRHRNLLIFLEMSGYGELKFSISLSVLKM